MGGTGHGVGDEGVVGIFFFMDAWDVSEKKEA